MIPDRITLHCSGSKNGKPLSAKSIDEYHRSQGWKSCGYHIILGVDGLIENAGNSPCRGLNEIGAHVSGANEGNIGICLIGTDRFTMDQLEVLRSQLGSLQCIYSIPDRNIFCHYEFESAKKQGKTCPSIRAANLLCWYRLWDFDAIEPWLLK